MTNTTTSAESALLYQQAIATFKRLLDEARASGDPEATAMTLATAGEGGRICARIVLLKQADEEGFRFYTNYTSAKAAQLEQTPHAALCFHWKTLRNGVQVRVEGRIEKVSPQESEVYFASRPRGSQIGAWASLQSQTLPNRDEFEARIAQFEQRFVAGPVPRPPHWGGYLMIPDRIEFWYGADFRLHERQLYVRGDSGWTRRMLYP
ncbi:MAG: pyridoxamine 5'-phosphate oxidase [Rhodanobacter sp.]|jgi:pyridoxamine 5'-phosphate oxidase|nr:pyridoxamine 5'-phosphate oxidase [Rhodanobacter sp.]